MSVLSIQSHVVHGYVGNKAAVFPLQLLGLEVDIINSVHFSNHTGYPNGFKGTIMDGNQLLTILEGLERNDLLDKIQYVLTGYIGSESFLDAIRTLILRVKEHANTSKYRYLCDPVLGDNGKLYVPIELVSLFQSKIIPLADIVTPNQFEAETLTGIKIQSIDDAKESCRWFHDLGPSIVFLTSLSLPPLDEINNNTNKPKTEIITILASQRRIINGETIHEVYRIDCPEIPGSYTGTGDLTAALILGHLDKNPDNLAIVMEKVVNTMQAVIQRTSQVDDKSFSSTPKSKELKLIQSKSDIEHPPCVHVATRIQ